MHGSPPTVQIALPLPLENTFTYRWSDALGELPTLGRRVLVPFGKRRMAGYVVELHPPGAAPREIAEKRVALRDVLALLDDEPLFGPEELRFFRWVSGYYLASLGETLRTALPVSMHLRSCRAVRVLPRGLLALEHGLFLTDPEREILALLKKTGIRSIKALQEKTGGSVERAVRGLAEKGFAEPARLVRGSRERPGRRPLLAECALPASDPSLPDLLGLLDAAEARVLQTLVEQGPCLSTELGANGEDTESALSRLLDKGLVRMRLPVEGLPERACALPPTGDPPEPTPQQRAVLDRLLPGLEEPAYHPVLLHGVTGSGKTEIYLNLIDRALRAGRDALVLVPEIGLTPQTVHRFRARFGPHIAVLHSAVLESERLEWWWRIRKGLVKIAIGTRSAVFAPFRNLGILVVDEEHDPSYKQQDRLRYNARDLALVRGQMGKAMVVLGSATPSLESYHNARSGKIGLLELSERIEGQPLPPIVCVDVRERSTRRDPGDAVSLPLEQRLQDNLKAGKKSLLFLNRRGYAPTVVCSDCGHLFRCPRCSVTLTFHRARKGVCCHYCEHQGPQPTRCPACSGSALQAVGKGTERIEEEIRALLPEARIGRMDRDTTRKRGAQEQLLSRFRGDGLDVLIGTQMIAKGLDFPNVTLVGVVAADASLSLPDFRAAERTFQLITQVAGRAGRSDRGGRVVVQTFQPNHYSIRCAAAQDFKAFAARELQFRKEQGYPPFGRLARILVTGRKEAEVRARAKALASRLSSARGATILGPAPAPVEVIRNRFRHQIVVKASGDRAAPAVQAALDLISSDLFTGKSTRVIADVDPQSMM